MTRIASARIARRTLAALALAACGATPALAQTSDQTPSQPDWSRWAAHNPAEPSAVDHRPWDQFLQVFHAEERGDAALNFTDIKARGLTYLGQYIRYLERIPVSRLNRDEQLAYWLNLHNAGVVRAVARAYPVRNLGTLRGEPGAPGEVWAKPVFDVEGQRLSLEDIEQRILLAQWADPVVLYGLCYAAKGSPSLPAAAFTGANVHGQLAEVAADFVNDRKGVRVRRGKLEVSSLYVWNDALFGDDAALIAHLSEHAKPRLAERLADVEGGVAKHRFDWKTADFRPRNNVNVGGGFGGGGGGAGGGGFGGGS